MHQPLVTIVCLCYNHSEYLEETLQSVIDQSYENIEVILVDDYSTDNSVHKLKKYASQYDWKTIFNEENLGNCKSFNNALKISKGKYIIDLACDDILLTNRVLLQVKQFEQLPSDYCIVYSNALYIDQFGKIIKKHEASRNIQPSGDVYEKIVESYFICSPTVMVRTALFKEIGGYDESLSFEDWDFWLRIGRNYKFKYLDEITTKKRVLKSSMSFSFFGQNSYKMHTSVLKICRKIESLNKSESERQALAKRLKYEIKETFLAGDYKLVPEFYKILKRNTSRTFIQKMIVILSYVKPFPLRYLYQIYRTSKSYK